MHQGAFRFFSSSLSTFAPSQSRIPFRLLLYMIEQTYILEGVDPVVFYGVNNGHLQLLRTLYPKLRIVARGNVVKVIGEEDE